MTAFQLDHQPSLYHFFQVALTFLTGVSAGFNLRPTGHLSAILSGFSGWPENGAIKGLPG
jgi:hypothetical protein